MFLSTIKSIRTACLAVACCVFTGSLPADFPEGKKGEGLIAKTERRDPEGWKRFYSAPGACSVSMPGSPEHIKQIMPLSDGETHLSYDVYLAAYEKSAVYMLLIAQYPEISRERIGDANLENFLNGLIMQNPENRLMFADLVDIRGIKALDFFIRSGTTYFKGRVAIIQNTLYLIAMECDKKNYLDSHFKHFINSFTLPISSR